MSAIVSTEELQRLSDLKRKQDLENWLRSQNIRYFHSRKGPWTTTGVIEPEQRFTLHPVKRRGVTDTAGNRSDKQTASGHKDEKRRFLASAIF